MELTKNSGIATPTTAMIWRIDASRSRIEFAISKRLMFVRQLTVTGGFTDVTGVVAVDTAHPEQSRATVSIGAASIETGNARRDTHLRAADFLDVTQFPTISFTSSTVQVVDQSNGRYRIVGDLTVRGVTREVTLKAQYTGPLPRAVAPVAQVTATTTINRRDFGITWNKPYINVQDELQVTLDITLAVDEPRIG